MTTPISFAVGPPDDPDRYLLREPCGIGGESIVYRAFHGDRQVAVKILRDDHGGRLDQFAREWTNQVELLRTLRHRAVVRPIEAFVGTSLHRVGTDSTGRTLCLVMDWIAGRQLDDVLRVRSDDGHRYTLEILRSLRPVAEALDLMHRGDRTGGEPVVHGDIKPSNLLLKASGEAVLVDFGLAGALARQPTGGTPKYRAPESYRLGNSPASDAYSFAAVVAAVLHSERPTDEGGTVPIDSSLVRRGTDADPQQRPACLAEWLESVIAEHREAHRRSLSSGSATWSFPDRWSQGLVDQLRVAMVAAMALTAALGATIAARATASDEQVEFNAARSARAVDARFETCDADLWREAAEQSFPVRWADPDGDCLHTLYELNGLGLDPFVHNDVSRLSLEGGLNEQATSIVWQLVNGTRRHDPVMGRVTCDPGTWRATALRWSPRDNPRNATWDDPDEDCLTTRYELLVGTDPANPDSDGDGFLDSIDPHETNGLIAPQHRQMGLVLRRQQLASAHDLTAADTRERFEMLKVRLDVD